jgi:hypothetical protein
MELRIPQLFKKPGKSHNGSLPSSVPVESLDGITTHVLSRTLTTIRNSFKLLAESKGNAMGIKTPKNGLKAVAKAKWEAEQAARKAETAAKSAAFAKGLAK